MQLFTLQSDEAYYYGFVFFRQTKDKSIRRGYFQKVWNMHTEIDEIMVLALVFIIISTEETGYLPVIILDFPWPQHWAFWPQKSSIFIPLLSSCLISINKDSADTHLEKKLNRQLSEHCQNLGN